jgi:hypothetical protein
MSWRLGSSDRVLVGTAAQVVAHLPHEHRALSLNTSTANKTKSKSVQQVFILFPVTYFA